MLVVEDNATNQALVRHVLGQRGHRVATADTGHEAVALAARQRFDVILMDVQMPGMDGYEATAAIRAQPDGPNVATPIVAVTAHAMSGDRERCLSVGMNAFVGKPLRPEALLAALDGLFGGVPAPVPTAAAAPVAALDREALLETFGHDRGLLRETIDVFLADAPLQLQALRNAAEAGDAGALGRAAHALKGAVSLFSLGPAYQAARSIEMLARHGLPSRLTTRMAAMERALARLSSGLSELRMSLGDV